MDNAKRLAVRNAYSSDGWKKRVDRMPENQIVALYMKFKKEGRIK